MAEAKEFQATIKRGIARKFGDDINTDYIIAAKRKTQSTDLDELVKHIMEDIRPGFYNELKPGDFIVGGKNFGCGSSRENAPQLLKHAGISCVVATSFARIFFRNCVSVGLLPVICDTSPIDEGDVLELDAGRGELRDVTKGLSFKITPLPKVMQDILKEGGVLNYILKYGSLGAGEPVPRSPENDGCAELNKDTGNATRVEIPIGTTRVRANVPNLLAVMRPKEVPCHPDPAGAVREALSRPIGTKPLSELARGKKTVAVIVNDITRPYPGGLLVREIARELNAAGIRDEYITLVVACGNHRPNTDEELRVMFGDEVCNRFRIVNHNAADESALKYLGTTDRGIPIYVNKIVADADLKIATGLITPHHAAGFSGGRKSILPGVSGLKTLNIHHSLPIRPYDPAMGWYDGNPFHEEALKAARMVGLDFIVNTIDNDKREVVAVVAGDVDLAHRAGVEICRKIWTVEVPRKADVVITSPGGYPRDCDLHQSQKALSCAEMVCREGGIIILCAEARDGIGKFGNWLKEAKTPQEVIERYKREGYTAEASAKAFMYARAFVKHKVMITGCKVPPEELSQMFMHPKPDLDTAIGDALAELGTDASFIVIPYASDMIPLVRQPCRN
ncbi:MAG TPA: nickel-dependent lactate racemase [Firmicutes bacterium]|nr:nickel-dependent lactate racemase [Candidatus Fermentithermobacillaceae bacterium]